MPSDEELRQIGRIAIGAGSLDLIVSEILFALVNPQRIGVGTHLVAGAPTSLQLKRIADIALYALEEDNLPLRADARESLLREVLRLGGATGQQQAGAGESGVRALEELAEVLRRRLRFNGRPHPHHEPHGAWSCSVCLQIPPSCSRRPR